MEHPEPLDSWPSVAQEDAVDDLSHIMNFVELPPSFLPAPPPSRLKGQALAVPKTEEDASDSESSVSSAELDSEDEVLAEIEG